MIVQRLNGGVIHQPRRPSTNTKTTAIDAYLARVAAIHIKWVQLQELANDHFGHDPEAIHWGHVGDLGRVNQALDDLLAIFDGQAK
ncbi:hypothetical protein [Zoogloea sp.]|uniref:hypothetical protein n=1 Tax=Zoogloea sp. TaxID=49181 RepID=UPI00263411A8|nr:hypothetical protein [Zoogloea sp.]MDD3353322.1 hypothetical protein [Zoogloea sp.]